MLSPRERWGELFEQVQLTEVFPEDCKTFVDCDPKYPAEQILSNYAEQKNSSEFDLVAFVHEHFDLPPNYGPFIADASKSMGQHITDLWPILTRQPDAATDGSLIPLPFPYIVPGGRFGEIYYWDSYFTMQGLLVDGQEDMAENMVKNLAHLIDEVGFIPNGNRSYFLTRSQPPFFAAMVSLLDRHKGGGVVVNFLPQLLREYDFWMSGTTPLLNENYRAEDHVVLLAEGHILNRYYDRGDYPREESYREDLETAKESKQSDEVLYRELRAGGESGWDFSSRWLADWQNLSTIHTTDIIPVDLNALLYHLEMTIARGYESLNEGSAAKFKALACQRKQDLDAYCWDEEGGFYRDYDFKAQAFTPILSMAAAYPLYFGMASQEQANRVAKILESDFLAAGGFRSTLVNSGQQWDAPNGWAPLQWIAYRGLKNYGLDLLANTARQRWLSANLAVYERDTKMVEKYDVSGMLSFAGGGEYPLQDGFGWSNGVAQAMLREDK